MATLSPPTPSPIARVARVLEATPENLAFAGAELRAGKLVAMPTETVYGLAGSALDSLALAAIFETKERPTFDPLIVHVSPEWGSLERLEAEGLIRPQLLGAHALENARKLMREFWPGPLTLVLPKGPRVPDLATSGLPSVAIRVPAHPVAQALLSHAAIPLAAPSANRFGRISPTSSQDVLQELGERIEWIIEGGRCEIGVESTVVSVDGSGLLALLRPGGISLERLEELTGTGVATPRRARADGVPSESAPAPSPGMLLSHYAPVKPLWLLPTAAFALNSNADALQELRAEISRRALRSVGLLVQQGEAESAAQAVSAAIGLPVVETLVLSRSGKLSESAQNLFSMLRELDQGPGDFLLAEPCPSAQGLGHAIADRLNRAAAKRP